MGAALGREGWTTCEDHPRGEGWEWICASCSTDLRVDCRSEL